MPTPAAESVFRYFSTPHQGSHRLADLVLTALFAQDMHRPRVRDRARVAYVLGCMLLAELHQARQLSIGGDGTVYPARTSTLPDDSALSAVLTTLRSHRANLPAVRWFGYLALDDHATTLVWQRLVELGAAQQERTRLRKRLRYGLTELRATRWARSFLYEGFTGGGVPHAAVLLWRGLQELRLDARALDLEPGIACQLETHEFPAELEPLFDALSEGLARLATPL